MQLGWVMSRDWVMPREGMKSRDWGCHVEGGRWEEDYRGGNSGIWSVLKSVQSRFRIASLLEEKKLY